MRLHRLLVHVRTFLYDLLGELRRSLLIEGGGFNLHRLVVIMAGRTPGELDGCLWRMRGIRTANRPEDPFLGLRRMPTESCPCVLHRAGVCDSQLHLSILQSWGCVVICFDGGFACTEQKVPENQG